MPSEIAFRFAEVDRELSEATSTNMGAGGYAPNEMIWDAQIANVTIETVHRCAARGVTATPAYESFPRFYQNFTAGEKLAYDAALRNLPIVNDAAVTWGNILEFRRDPESVRKYRDLRVWLRDGLQATSLAHATDIVAQRIENYRWAIRKHGLATRIGSFTQILDVKTTPAIATASAVATALAGSIAGAVTAGLLVGGQIAAWLAERRLQLADVARGEHSEVAILYDAQERFGSAAS